MQYNRASFAPRDVVKVHNSNLKVSLEDRCFESSVFVRGRMADIFKPISIEMKYDTVEKMLENSQEFCTTCVTLDPRDSKTISTKVTFSTGCSGERCISDLAVVGTLVNVRQPYVLGSTHIITIEYEISNKGESAYLTQLKITIPTNITQFSRIPPECHEENNNRDMVCDLNSGKPIANGEIVKLSINLDATKLDGESLKVLSVVSSAGDEQRPADNQYENQILLTEFSDVELIG